MLKTTVGAVEITPIVDTPVLMRPQFLFGADRAVQFDAEYGERADERGFYPMSITCYLVRSAGKTILVDTGIGPRRRPNFPPGRLPEALRDAGLEPGDVDVVVNTHLHLDHVGWNTYDDESGVAKVYFPRATWVIQQTEWDHWMRPEYLESEAQPHLAQCVAPIRDSGQVRLVSGEEPLDEHITFIPAPGHTPGHVAIGIASQGERAVIIGDASHHPAQLDHLDWSPGADTDPSLAAKTRDRLFDEAAADGRLWIAGHWEYPGLGRIVRLDGKRVFRAL